MKDFEPREITLCRRCQSDYDLAGYSFKVKYPLQREECDKCERMGVLGTIDKRALSRDCRSNSCNRGSFFAPKTAGKEDKNGKK